MTVDEFKKLKPEYKDIDGHELWNAMEDYMLRQQSGQEVMKTIMPFFKLYQLRWAFYRNVPNWSLGKDNDSSSERCASCKKGVSSSFGYAFNGKFHFFCPHCSKDLVKEKNTNIRHYLWIVFKKVSKAFWWVLNEIHLVRSAHNDRYGMFGDEYKYVEKYTINFETDETVFTLRKRKWWEHLFIERKSFNF